MKVDSGILSSAYMPLMSDSLSITHEAALILQRGSQVMTALAAESDSTSEDKH